MCVESGLPGPGTLSLGVWQVYLVLIPGNPNQGKSKRDPVHRRSYQDQWFSPFRMCSGNCGSVFSYHIIQGMLTGVWWPVARVGRCVEQFHRTENCPAQIPNIHQGTDMGGKPIYNYLNINLNSNFISPLHFTYRLMLTLFVYVGRLYHM